MAAMTGSFGSDTAMWDENLLEELAHLHGQLHNARLAASGRTEQLREQTRATRTLRTATAELAERLSQVARRCKTDERRLHQLLVTSEREVSALRGSFFGAEIHRDGVSKRHRASVDQIRAERSAFSCKACADHAEAAAWLQAKAYDLSVQIRSANCLHMAQHIGAEAQNRQRLSALEVRACRRTRELVLLRGTHQALEKETEELRTQHSLMHDHVVNVAERIEEETNSCVGLSGAIEKQAEVSNQLFSVMEQRLKDGEAKLEAAQLAEQAFTLGHVEVINLQKNSIESHTEDLQARLSTELHQALRNSREQDAELELGMQHAARQRLQEHVACCSLANIEEQESCREKIQMMKEEVLQQRMEIKTSKAERKNVLSELEEEFRASRQRMVHAEEASVQQAAQVARLRDISRHLHSKLSQMHATEIPYMLEEIDACKAARHGRQKLLFDVRSQHEREEMRLTCVMQQLREQIEELEQNILMANRHAVPSKSGLPAVGIPSNNALLEEREAEEAAAERENTEAGLDLVTDALHCADNLVDQDPAALEDVLRRYRKAIAQLAQQARSDQDERLCLQSKHEQFLLAEGVWERVRSRVLGLSAEAKRLSGECTQLMELTNELRARKTRGPTAAFGRSDSSFNLEAQSNHDHLLIEAQRAAADACKNMDTHKAMAGRIEVEIEAQLAKAEMMQAEVHDLTDENHALQNVVIHVVREAHVAEEAHAALGCVSGQLVHTSDGDAAAGEDDLGLQLVGHALGERLSTGRVPASASDRGTASQRQARRRLHEMQVRHQEALAQRRQTLIRPLWADQGLH